jgi:hypothetical protein
MCVLPCRYDRLVLPIHQLSPYQHWSVLLVDLQQRRLVFFDSYKEGNPIRSLLMQRVKQWLAHEAQVRLALPALYGTAVCLLCGTAVCLLCGTAGY